jgi:hypothetical protein
MPALQKAKPSPVSTGDITFTSVTLPTQTRTTQVIKDASPEQIAADIVAWIKGG